VTRDQKRIIYVRCTPEEAETIRKAAKAERRTLSNFVLNALFVFNRGITHRPEEGLVEPRSRKLDRKDVKATLDRARQTQSDYVAARLARAQQRTERTQMRLAIAAQRHQRQK
jgi:uncharacterized protein (DUF1778 family)